MFAEADLSWLSLDGVEAARFAEPLWLLAAGLALIPLAYALLEVLLRRRALRRFAQWSLVTRLRPRRGASGVWGRALVLALVFIAGAVALARPQWGEREEHVHRTGRDVVFVLDVSRSMLAEDLAPNRLERAKLWISDVIDTLDGDRVGLVAFAGGAILRVPLTHDYGYFRLSLDTLTPESVQLGGTMVGDGVRRAMRDVFLIDEDADNEVEARLRDIVLITDGEDQGSFPVEAAAAAGRAGVRLIAIGIGSEGGVPIPITGPGGATEFVTDSAGKRVISSLDARTLRDMAAATPEGRYLGVGTGNVKLDEVYQRFVRSAEQQEQESARIVAYEERYQLAALVVLALLLVEIGLGVWRRA